MRPAVLLDVDGVLNPLSVSCPAGFIELRLAGYDVQLNPALHTPMLRQLAQVGELVWATTWEHDANAFISGRYGLPADLDVIEIAGADATAPTWKLADIAAWADRHPDRPIVWLDDEARQDAHQWAAGRAAATLIVAVDGQTGITQQHVDQVLSWAGGLTKE